MDERITSTFERFDVAASLEFTVDNDTNNYFYALLKSSVSDTNTGLKATAYAKVKFEKTNDSFTVPTEAEIIRVVDIFSLFVPDKVMDLVK